MDRIELAQYMMEHMIDIEQLWNFIEALPNMPYDHAWFHDCKMRSVVPCYDEEFYEYMSELSQCDECGEVKIGLPLMAKYLECPAMPQREYTNPPPTSQQFGNIFGSDGRNTNPDKYNLKRHQRWHLPDVLKGHI